MASYLDRTLRSPRWAWLNRIVGPYYYSGDPPNQWLRQVMNVETEKLVAGIQPAERKALEISGNFWDRSGLFREYQSIGYPEYDVCAGPLPETFDLIIAEQVFEHIPWPYRAGKNVYEMLNPGGYFLITTPFLLKIHDFPMDCSRWTVIGMKHLLAECGFPMDHIVAGSWGNRSVVKANMGNRWVIYKKWLHSLANEEDYPIVVWALARKPL